MTLPAGRLLSTIRGLAVAMALAGGLLPPAPVSAQVAAAEAATHVPMPRARARMNARVFDTVWNTVHRQYYDPGLHGVDWRAARQTYRPMALAATDDRQLYRAIGQMLALLDDQHAGAISPAMARRQDVARTRRAVMGIVLSRETFDVWRVDAVRPGSPAEEAGIQPGWRLQSVDGQAWGVDFAVEDGRPLRLDLTDEQGVLHSLSVVPREMEPIPAFSLDDSRPGVVVLRAEGFESGMGRWLGEQLSRLSPGTEIGRAHV